MELLIPHRPPWLVLDRVLACEPERIVAEKHVSVDDPWVGPDGLGGLLVIDLVAQAAACLMARRVAQRGSHLGYLVAAQGWKFQAPAAPGEILTLEVERRAELGALIRFAGRAHVAGREIAAGELTCAVRVSNEAGTTG